MVLFLTLPVLPLKAETPTPVSPTGGVVEGQVINATEGRPTGPITVTLHVLQGEAEVSGLESQADEQGRFRFAGLDSRPEVSYRAEAVYKGLGFSSGPPLSFQEDRQALSLPIEVYEATASDADVSLGRAHYIIEYDREHVYLAELYLFDNGGRTVYVGKEGADGRPETVRVTLPTGAQNVGGREGEAGRFKLAADALTDTAPILPGTSTQALFFTYALPYRGDSFVLEREVPYAVEKVNVLSADTGPQLSGGQLTWQGTFQAGGQTYRNYKAAPLAKGAKLTIEIGWLSRLNAAGSAEPEAAIPQHTLRQLGVGLAVLALAAMGAYPWLQRSSPTAETQRGDRRRELLQAIADLDDAHESGELDESGYRSRREQYKAELTALLGGQPGR